MTTRPDRRWRAAARGGLRSGTRDRSRPRRWRSARAGERQDFEAARRRQRHGRRVLMMRRQVDRAHRRPIVQPREGVDVDALGIDRQRHDAVRRRRGTLPRPGDSRGSRRRRGRRGGPAPARRGRAPSGFRASRRHPPRRSGAPASPQASRRARLGAPDGLRGRRSSGHRLGAPDTRGRRGRSLRPAPDADPGRRCSGSAFRGGARAAGTRPVRSAGRIRPAAAIARACASGDGRARATPESCVRRTCRVPCAASNHPSATSSRRPRGPCCGAPARQPPDRGCRAADRRPQTAAPDVVGQRPRNLQKRRERRVALDLISKCQSRLIAGILRQLSRQLV